MPKRDNHNAGAQNEIQRLRQELEQARADLERERLLREAAQAAPPHPEITPLNSTQKSVTDTSRLLATMLDNTHVNVAFMDTDFNFILVNRAYAEGAGHPVDFFPGKNHFDLYPHEENQAIFRQVVDTGTPHYTYAKAFEFPDQPERGVTYWDWSLAPIQDDGRVTAVLLSLSDVTERHVMELKLKAEHDQLLSVFNSIDEIICVSDPETREILFANRVMKQALGNDIAGRSLGNVFERPQQGRIGQALDAHESGVIHWEHYNKYLNRWFRCSGRRIQWPHGRDALFELAVDVTDRKQDEEELKRYREELEKLVEKRTGELTLANRRLKNLSRKIISAQEEERARVAMNLHDEMGQQLTALTMEVEWLQKKGEVVHEDLQNLEDTIHNIHQALQRIYKGLRPAALDNLGLEAAIQSLIWEYRDFYDFEIKTDIQPGSCDMEPDRAIIVYRILQEALTNAARHAQATRVDISMNRRDHEITLEIKDNGVGLGPGDPLDSRQGFGIMGMRERAAIAGGKLSLASDPGCGACITFVLNV